MTDIIKRLREGAMLSGASTPTIQALLSEAGQLLERGWKPSEEAVARIIDPAAFRWWAELRACSSVEEADRQYGRKCNLALTKARAILALSPDPAFLGEIEEGSAK